MQIFQTINSIKDQLESHRKNGELIGLVPTMGYLHRGHAELIRQCRKESDVTVCSIFVNPTQFNNPEDLINYPTSLDNDLEMLKKLNCDYVFQPSVDEMYPEPTVVSMKFELFDELLEGKFRPDHFQGVGLVVAKLFNIIRPGKAFFGKKDLQQLMLVRRLVKDLSMDIEVIGVNTQREDSGLAMSSRNARLSNEEREVAANIHRALAIALEEMKLTGNIENAVQMARNLLMEYPVIEVEYLEIVDAETFGALPIPVISHENKVAICIAASIGEIRLIDNILMEVGEKENAD